MKLTKAISRVKVANLGAAARSGLKVAWRLLKELEPLVVVVSVVLIFLQLRQQTQLTRATNTQSLVELVLPLNMQLAGDKEMARLWLRGAGGFDDGAEITDRHLEAERYDTMIASFLIFHENVFLQHRGGLLDDDIYAAWDRDLARGIVSGQHLDKYWDDEKKSAYHPDFARHVDDLIRQERTAQVP